MKVFLHDPNSRFQDDCRSKLWTPLQPKSLENCACNFDTNYPRVSEIVLGILAPIGLQVDPSSKNVVTK